MTKCLLHEVADNMLTPAPINGQNNGWLHGSFNKELQGLGIKYDTIAANFIICSVVGDVSPVIFIFKHILDVFHDILYNIGYPLYQFKVQFYYFTKLYAHAL